MADSNEGTNSPRPASRHEEIINRLVYEKLLARRGKQFREEMAELDNEAEAELQRRDAENAQKSTIPAAVSPRNIKPNQSEVKDEAGSPPPPADKPEQGEGKGGTDMGPEQPEIASAAAREAVLSNLEAAVRKAYYAFQYAESKAGKRLEDQEAYKLLKDEGIPTDKGDLGELTDYKLPSFDTWSRQVRNARKPLREQKYTRRAGRPTGSSIVKGDEIENQRGADD